MEFSEGVDVKGKKILILVWPETSAYNATFRLARVLSQRSHEIVYAVPDGWKDYVARQGFETVCLDILSESTSASTDLWRFFITSRGETRRRLQGLCESLTLVESGGFSLVLLYPTLWYYAPALCRLNVPFIVVNPCLASISNLEIPPVFSNLQPLDHPLANLIQCALAWFALRYFGTFHHRYRGIIQPYGFNSLAWIRDVSAMARHFLNSVLDRFHRPVYYQLLKIARQEGIDIGWGDYGHRLQGPELVLGPQAIDFPRRISQYTRLYVGACIDTDRVEDAFDWSSVDDGRPIVYCAVGSHGGYWNSEIRLRLIESVVEVYKDRPETQLLLQVKDESELKYLEPLPDSVLAAPWFPQLQVLSRASLFICHGGFGSVREALFYGVPMMIFPCGVDQPGNAARVTWAGAGLMGDIRFVTPAIIGAMLEAIENQRCRDNATRLSRVLQAENTCSEAVDLIETGIMHFNWRKK